MFSKILSITVVLVSLFTYWYLWTISLTKISERHTCPYCYGESYCSELHKNVFLIYNSLNAIAFNLLSVKNVYFANNGEYDVVIKKLGSKSKLAGLGEQMPIRDNTIDLKNALMNPHRDFQVCNNLTALHFLQEFNGKNRKNLWTIININAEPLLLELFNHKYFAVPRLIGYCGRAVIEQHSGNPLNSIENFDWYKRAKVAKQLLKAAEQFTFGHAKFRLYLTDISPDNIAISDDLVVTFVDLGHGILIDKSSVISGSHYTEPFNDDEYGFSRQEVCGSAISDHNVYAVCKLLLSVTAPWPMMRNGLLHSPPPELNAKDLFEHIEQCVYTTEKVSRFKLCAKIQQILDDIVVQVL
ncbi:divergent protein kinase domain 2A-like isoform X2 [Anthonomus grandis grandis]|uniref:divergent protein kinase domain 2A-like isoform X2 n=1 Tax=Anthonomus grandis grandis TaxID=2921223 RepID=UPI00216611FF|nr:divergent protein kinase domain 2A-like isoform X2 [Anthonomus grandis grandis]